MFLYSHIWDIHPIHACTLIYRRRNRQMSPCSQQVTWFLKSKNNKNNNLTICTNLKFLTNVCKNVSSKIKCFEQIESDCLIHLCMLYVLFYIYLFKYIKILIVHTISALKKLNLQYSSQVIIIYSYRIRFYIYEMSILYLDV